METHESLTDYPLTRTDGMLRETIRKNGALYLIEVWALGMFMVVACRRLAPWTVCFVGVLLALYITLESPFSGMSINPARTVGSALWAQVWTGLWLYFVGPVAAWPWRAGSTGYVTTNGTTNAARWPCTCRERVTAAEHTRCCGEWTKRRNLLTIKPIPNHSIHSY